MAKYLLSVHSVEGEVGDPMTEEQMQRFMERVNALEQEMRSTGAWLFGAPSTIPRRQRSCGHRTVRC